MRVLLRDLCRYLPDRERSPHTRGPKPHFVLECLDPLAEVIMASPIVVISPGSFQHRIASYRQSLAMSVIELSRITCSSMIWPSRARDIADASVRHTDSNLVLGVARVAINDLLKSMVLQDLGNGHVSAVFYQSRDPIDKTLKSFAINLTQNPGYGQILNQAKSLATARFGR